MSQVIELCGDSDDNGEWPNTAAVPPPSFSRKRPRDKEKSSYDVNPRHLSGPGSKTATGSAEFVVDLENDSDDSSEEALPDQAGDWANKFKELCEYRKSKGHCLFRCHDPEYAELSKWVSSQRCDHWHRRMVGGKDYILTPERVNALDGIGFVWNPPRPCWEDRLSELAEYRKIHGHCNVPERYSENIKLGKWVKTQRYQHKLHREGKTSPMTTVRIQALESLGFEWRGRGTSWEDHLNLLADYRKIHGHCNASKNRESSKLGEWVANQRTYYRLHAEGKASPITLSRIQQLESLGFKWEISVSWEGRLSELADYRKNHGHCNVPKIYSENSKLASWVSTQRSQYKLHQEGRASPMTTFRIQELESIGFEWKPSISRRQGTPKMSQVIDLCGDSDDDGEWPNTASLPPPPLSRKRPRDKEESSKDANPRHLSGPGNKIATGSAKLVVILEEKWETRLSELADYHKIHGHGNVPERYRENIKLGKWVKIQRYTYKLHQEGKTSPMTESRIQALENLGIEWSTARTSWEASFEELTDYLKIHGHCTVSISGNSKLVRWISTQRTQYRLYPGERSHMTLSRIQGLESIGFEWSCSSWGDRLGELADYRIIHGHCNVPPSYSENIQLARWVTYQRSQYKLQLEGNTSHLTPRRIQELESIGFEWKPSISRRQGTPKKPSLDDDDATRVCERAAESPEHMQPHSLKKISVVENSAAVKSTSLSNPTGMANSTLLDAAVAVWLQVGTM
jgi:hypothetical protein